MKQLPPEPVTPLYRAVLNDYRGPTAFQVASFPAERPLEIFGNDLDSIKTWAFMVLRVARSPEATVHVFKRTEQQEAVITLPSEQYLRCKIGG